MDVYLMLFCVACRFPWRRIPLCDGVCKSFIQSIDNETQGSDCHYVLFVSIIIDQFDVSSKCFLPFLLVISLFWKCLFRESGLFLQLLVVDKCFSFQWFLSCLYLLYFFFSFYKKGGIVKLFFYSFVSMCSYFL